VGARVKARPLLLFAPGAGAGSDSDWMRAWAERLSSLGRVVAFDYDYRREGRRAPDRLPRLLSAHRAALEAARQGHRGPVVLVGKSMGGRVGCHLALETPVDAVVALGYPLVGVRRRDGSQPVRGEVLEALEVPLLLVQGSRDRLFPMERWAEQAPRLKTPWTLHAVEHGDHSLLVPKTLARRGGPSQAEVDAAILAAIATHLDRHLGGATRG
jgi:predicted alpha/beta-hydrolase family hydrolase